MENKKQEKDGFIYTYSAGEQAEIRRIRDKYTAPTEVEDKMSRLRRLDASVSNTAQAVSLVFGVIGTLVLGFGMSLIMTELSDALGFSENTAMAVGITVGVVGGALASLAYPMYNAIVRAKRKKIAPEIIRLTDELIK
ncbi:MAG: hypothetical protein IKC61_00825 [Clostridia bacterium]|nr:hypothetical protein [Clostridia bacterium]